MSSIILRKFADELAAFVGKTVVVETSEGKHYTGTLVALDENLNVILDKVSGAGENVFKLVANGTGVREIHIAEKPYDFKGLADRLARTFPGLVSVREDIGAIIVMDKIKVTEKGVVEGSGLAADKAKAIYDEYMREIRK